MKTGDHVHDGNGRTFQVGQLLGRGLWGKCYLAREESDGSEWVLKVPLGEDDLPRQPPRLAEVCREIAREQGRFLAESGAEGLVDVQARFVADDGSPAILMPRYPETLERRMANAAPLSEVLATLTATMAALKALAPVLHVHGGIKPSNIMLDTEGKVRLMDPITPTLKRYLPILAKRDGYLGDGYLPREIRTAESDPTLSPTVDTFSLAMMLFRAATVPVEGATPQALPDAGLKKGGVQTLKDHFHHRLKAEPSNPRFHARLADRATAIVNRAISLETSPSPPYRFNKVDELAKRLAEVTALIHPTIGHVGKLILNRPPAQNGFGTDEDVCFSCSVGATMGVETHEEIAAGIAVFDQETQARVQQVSCAYTVDRHPSGRFRFSFRIADLPPGKFLVRVAYTIRDSGHEPVTAEESFLVNAAPGYVPPRAETAHQPLSISQPGTAAQELRVENTPQSPPANESPELNAPLDAVEEITEHTEAMVTPLHPNLAGTLDEPAFLAPAHEDNVEPVAFAIDAPGPIHSLPVNVGTPSPGLPTGVSSPIETEEPVYKGAGRWSELPLPNPGQTELPSAHIQAELTGEPLERGPVAELIGRGMSLIRSDTYTLFLGAAGLVILVLLAALWLLPSS